MRADDYGFDLDTGRHNACLTRAEGRFVGILWEDHVGRKKAIPAKKLARKFAKLMTGTAPLKDGVVAGWMREVRKMHNHLLRYHDKIPILSKAGGGGGYWIAADEAEAAEFYETFRKRGLTGLVKASCGRKRVLLESVEQLAFAFDELEDKSGFTGYIKPRGRQPMATDIVIALLEKMTGNPDKFADDLRKIGDRFGSVLLPKSQVAAVLAKAREFQREVERLGGGDNNF